VYFAQVRFVALRGGLDRLVARAPVRRANLAVLVCELERVDESKSFVYAAANGEVVDRDLQIRLLASLLNL
jgi:hypothetical protein